MKLILALLVLTSFQSAQASDESKSLKGAEIVTFLGLICEPESLTRLANWAKKEGFNATSVAVPSFEVEGSKLTMKESGITLETNEKGRWIATQDGRTVTGNDACDVTVNFIETLPADQASSFFSLVPYAHAKKKAKKETASEFAMASTIGILNGLGLQPENAVGESADMPKVAIIQAMRGSAKSDEIADQVRAVLKSDVKVTCSKSKMTVAGMDGSVVVKGKKVTILDASGKKVNRKKVSKKDPRFKELTTAAKNCKNQERADALTEEFKQARAKVASVVQTTPAGEVAAPGSAVQGSAPNGNGGGGNKAGESKQNESVK